MILIADAGSTKTAWAAVDLSTGHADIIRTSGINPATMSPDSIAGIIVGELLPALPAQKIEHIFYYGAGVVDSARADIIRTALALLSPAPVSVESDMRGAARSLLGHGSGIAAILGTGSNSCYCREGIIRSNIPPLGFILGDEGSGASLGKRFAADLFKGLLPA